MGNHCEICGTGEAGCQDPKVHLSRLAADVAVEQDMRFGKWTDETWVDEEKGRESRAFKYDGQGMGPGAHGLPLAMPQIHSSWS
jgi:hypothetical protein